MLVASSIDDGNILVAILAFSAVLYDMVSISLSSEVIIATLLADLTDIVLSCKL